MRGPGLLRVTLTAAPVDQAAALADEVLDPVTLAAADELVPARRAGHLAARTLLRLAVAAALGLDSDEVGREERCCEHCGGPHGRPRFVGSGLAVSLSRTRDTVVVATGHHDVALGVDVEDVPPRTGLPPAGLVLSPAELAGAPRPTLDRLLRDWTRKEAVLKATGHGLAVPMTALELGSHVGQPQLRRWHEDVAGRPAPAAPVLLRDLGPLPAWASGPVAPSGSEAVQDEPARVRHVGAVAVLGARAFEVTWAQILPVRSDRTGRTGPEVR